MSPSPLMKPWPGRNDTPQRREGELELVLLELCLVVRASQSHPSLTPRRQYFLSHHFALDGTRCALPREARSFVFILFYFTCGHKMSLPMITSLCVVYLAPTSLAGFIAICRLQAFCELRLSLAGFCVSIDVLRPSTWTTQTKVPVDPMSLPFLAQPLCS